MAEDNKSLARLQLTDIPPAPRGVPQIKVSFDIGADGILSVSAQDLGTGKTANLTVQPASGLTEEQLAQLEQEAEQKAVEDTVRREVADLRNRAETLVYTCERSLEAFADALSEQDREDIDHDLKELKELLAGEPDPESLRDALTSLETSSHQIYEAMMAAAEGEEGSGEG